MSSTTPKRADLQKFIKDDRTLRAFEELFNSLIFEPGDIVWSAAATRNGALLMDGSAVSRTLYADLFNAIGTTYGAGDGSTTFNLPDATGRVIASSEPTVGGSRLTVAGCGINGHVLGAAGGSQSATAPLPAHTHTGTTDTEGAHTHPESTDNIRAVGAGNVASGAAIAHNFSATSTGAGTAHSHTFTTGSTGSGTGVHANVQPTIVMNAFIIY